MLIVIGSLVSVAGIVFTFQSKSLVGPQSSFMYNNPEWTLNGLVILGAGIAVLISGFVSWIYTKYKNAKL